MITLIHYKIHQKRSCYRKNTPSPRQRLLHPDVLRERKESRTPSESFSVWCFVSSLNSLTFLFITEKKELFAQSCDFPFSRREDSKSRRIWDQCVDPWLEVSDSQAIHNSIWGQHTLPPPLNTTQSIRQWDAVWRGSVDTSRPKTLHL